MDKTFVIVNPAAGGGRAGKMWPAVCEKMLRSLGPFDFASTNGPGHARQLAMDATQEGYPFIVSCGGDGTAHEVVNGLLEGATKRPPTLGLVALGTGCDLARSLKIPRGIDPQISILAGKKTDKIDVGQMEYCNLDGGKERRIFVNVTDAGMGASVMIQSRSWKILSKRLAYLVGTFQTFARWKNKRMRLVLDDEEIPEEEYLIVAVANGRFFGAGMPIAPKASLVDGYFEVVTLGRLSPLELTMTLPLLYSKQLARLPHVSYHRAKRVKISSPDEVLLDIDGEPIGRLPASLEVRPKALEIKIP